MWWLAFYVVFICILAPIALILLAAVLPDV